MEFGIGETKRAINIVWNGPGDTLCKKLVISSVSQENSVKIHLHYPKMPTNHVMCLVGRLRRMWFNTVGRSSTGASKAHDALRQVNMQNELLTADDKLIEILEILGLDDVAPDLDLMAVKKWETENRQNSAWSFCFAPDDFEHFLKHVQISNEQMCYGRNGDEDL